VAVKRTGRGGPRKGAGRPPLGESARIYRVVVLLTPTEHAKLQELARERDLPPGTVAYEIVARALRRRSE
jgi:hypothetical protein